MDFIERSVNFSKRKDYVQSLNEYISSLFVDAELKRKEYTKNTSTEKRYDDFIKLLGSPFDGKHNKEISLIEKTKIANKYGADIFEMQFNVRSIKVYGLLFLPQNKENVKLPFSIFQHGADGTPEMAGSLLESSYNYNDVIKRLINKGIAIFAPQTLHWQVERYQTVYDKERIHCRLDLLGSSLKSLEMFLLQQIIDYFVDQPFVDSSRIGFMGLSWGAMYSLNMGALDKRIKATYCSCFFNDRSKYVRLSRCDKGQAFNFFDSELACLVYPRYLLIECANNDALFDVQDAKKEKAIYDEYIDYFNFDKNKIRFNFFDGEHECNPLNDNLDWFVEKLLLG